MRVYRIECPDGDRFGPYGPPPSGERFVVTSARHGTRLAVRDLYLGNEMRFACTFLETLKDWFAGYFDDLIAIGYVCAEYVTESYTVGKSQRQVGFTEWRSRRVIEI